MIDVLIVDDQSLVRSGFRVLLESCNGIRVVGEAADGQEGIAQAAALKPNVILMDIRMPEVDGIEATRAIIEATRHDLERPHILILTTFNEDEYVFEALRAGADGFVLKDIEPEALEDAVRVIAAGDSLLDQSITRSLIDEFVRGAQKAAEPDKGQLELLTEREKEVAALVGRGLSNDEIAKELYISPTTAKTHVARIMSKVDAHNRAQLVIFAYESGLTR